MAEIINPCQAGFVPGRRTSDNIILVQEVVQTLQSRRGGNGYAAIKLDLEKAYDSRGGNSCSRVGFVSCQVMSIRLHRSTLTRHVY